MGGVAQKAVTARQAGARLMIVPADEVHDAKAHAGDMKVVGVRNLDEALRALRRRGRRAPARLDRSHRGAERERPIAFAA